MSIGVELDEYDAILSLGDPELNKKGKKKRKKRKGPLNLFFFKLSKLQSHEFSFAQLYRRMYFIVSKDT